MENKPNNSLLNYAKTELEIAGLLDKSGTCYGDMVGKAVLELIECFAKQEHSGTSASIVRNLFNTLSDFRPINPLWCTDDEFVEVVTDIFQNKRLSVSAMSSGGLELLTLN